MSWRTSGKRAALSALHFSGAGGLMARLTGGAGVIFSLQRIASEERDGFSPNRRQSVTPEFLDAVIGLVRERGFEVLSLDEAHFRLSEGDLDRPFACFTFDLGYKDGAQRAQPIFRKHNVPFAVYLAPDYVDGRGEVWWLALEKAVGAAQSIQIKIDGVVRKLACATTAEKTTTYRRISQWLSTIAEGDARQVVAELARVHGIDMDGLCTRAMLDWGEAREISGDALVTIGAHTRRHYALSGMSLAAARLEIADSVQRLEAELGRPCRHFSYPYGDARSACRREFELVRELGLKTAVTTRRDLIRAHDGRAFTALPRIALNGELQQARYVKVMLSGVPFALANGARMMPFRPAAAH